MQLTSLNIENFKSIEKLSLKFNEKFNAFTGRNGIGKTNIIDSIYVLSCGRSYFNSVDNQVIAYDKDYYSLRGSFEAGAVEDEILCVLMRGRKKVIKKNEITYERILDHYGNYPVIMIAPNDIELIAGGSEDRRKWLDSVISMHDKEYLISLLKYDKLLQQRNAALKKLYAESQWNRQVVEIYDSLMAPLAHGIFEKRKKFIEEFDPLFNLYYNAISGKRELVKLKYQSQLFEGTMEHFFEHRFKQDVITQRSNFGPHKDDIEFTLFNYPVKKNGSQGQQKTSIFSLKLAQHKYILEKTGIKPILLLDDVCERLDASRIANLMQLITGDDFGQIFLTDTSSQRIQDNIPKGYPLKLFDMEELIV